MRVDRQTSIGSLWRRYLDQPKPSVRAWSSFHLLLFKRFLKNRHNAACGKSRARRRATRHVHVFLPSYADDELEHLIFGYSFTIFTPLTPLSLDERPHICSSSIIRTKCRRMDVGRDWKPLKTCNHTFHHGYIFADPHLINLAQRNIQRGWEIHAFVGLVVPRDVIGALLI